MRKSCNRISLGKVGDSRSPLSNNNTATVIGPPFKGKPLSSLFIDTVFVASSLVVVFFEAFCFCAFLVFLFGFGDETEAVAFTILMRMDQISPTNTLQKLPLSLKNTNKLMSLYTK